METGTTSDYLSPSAAAELLSRQEKLQSEAQHIIAELDISIILGQAGTVYQVGSFVSGLMVWRDLDFNVLSPGLSSNRVFAILSPLLHHPHMKMVRYLNQQGAFSPPDLKDERFFFALYYQPEGADEWKIDVSFWVSSVPRTERAPAEHIAGRLDDETRMAILWIKDVWRRLPTYLYQIGGVDIYDAVLDHDVRTPAQFRAYLSERGKPV
jgi:hypothetical protein